MLETVSHGVGVLGAALVVAAYYFLTSGKLSATSSGYYILNFIAAILLIFSLIFNFNLGSFLIELFWVGISVFGLAKVWRS